MYETTSPEIKFETKVLRFVIEKKQFQSGEKTRKKCDTNWIANSLEESLRIPINWDLSVSSGPKNIKPSSNAEIIVLA